MAYPVANTDFSSIATPELPDRNGWIVDYASSEYTVDDLKQGMPLKTLTNT
jgi:hypothetical protein